MLHTNDTNAVDAAGKERKGAREKGKREKNVNIQQINYRKSFQIAVLLPRDTAHSIADAIVYACSKPFEM